MKAWVAEKLRDLMCGQSDYIRDRVESLIAEDMLPPVVPTAAMIRATSLPRTAQDQIIDGLEQLAKSQRWPTNAK